MDLENKNVNAIRMLSIDIIENADSGHPGIALGAAPILYSLYSKHLNVIPDDDKNILRDRFVLSAGHGSSILYATLHSFGFNITTNDLKNFRTLDSKTPGHPEVTIVPGVDATTGPLGQGVAMAVGMAIAQKLMASRFNKPDITLFDNYTYTLVGEGCLMEGVSYEALSLAGSLNLNKFIVLYDCNKITLDGDLNGVMHTDVIKYMQSLGFNTIEVKDGNNVSEISDAIALAKKSKDKPTFIKINTHIGFGSIVQDTNKAHGTLLGAENVKLLREKLDVKSAPFEFEKDVARDLLFLRKRFNNVKKMFSDRLKSYSKYYPGDYKLLKSCIELKNIDIIKLFEDFSLDKDYSGREIGGFVLNKLAEYYPQVICGSADVGSSTKVNINNSGFINDNFANRNLKYGIREFGMSCISGGIALYGGLIPINNTYLAFSDYMKSSLRINALMKQKVISVFTHDSIAVGKDGATHQSSEQLWALRQIPNMIVYRPANLSEVVASYYVALNYNGPTSIVLSRQNLRRFDSSISDASLGGYILSNEQTKLDAIIIATGSEVSIALDVKGILESKGNGVRVVSMPSVEVFEMQSEKYKEKILPREFKSIFVVEAGCTIPWYKYAGKYGKVFGVDAFGDSASPEDIYNKFGLTASNISKEILSIIKSNK